MLEHWLPVQMLVESRSYDGWTTMAWSAWFDYAVYAASYGYQYGAFAYLDSANAKPWEPPSLISPVSSMGMGSGQEFRFTLQVPVACVVRWRTGRTDVDEDGYPIGTITWDDEQEVIVSVAASETISVDWDVDNLNVGEVLGVRFHPWS